MTSSKRPPPTETRMVNVDDVRRMQKDARKGTASELEKVQAELEASRFALHREGERTKELEKRLAVAKEAVYVRHERIRELEGKLKQVRVEVEKLAEAIALAEERIRTLTKPE